METSLFRCFSSIITESPISITHFLAATVLIIAVIYFMFRSKCIYPINFTCYRPPDILRVTKLNYIEHIKTDKLAEEESISFQAKVLERSGIGVESCIPVSLHEIPVDTSLGATTKKTEMVLFTVVNDLLSKHKINPKSIDILVSNCSLFCPMPSITSVILNKFGFSRVE
ncbi:unnamed protein product [Prunus armeniaca]|uniref:FAE domain-containing protein n=1 Tax=Prunus armeniaca TaxID=36596 RepID=A0A6J5TXM0_PRUAR|nr:unnamed protein product [Prunus armeniaca]